LLDDVAIEEYFQQKKIYIIESITLDKKVLIKKINNKEDGSLFRLMINEK
jgi:hypothetical protein